MKKGDKRTLRLGDKGCEVPVSYLGAGHWCKAYLMEDGRVLLRCNGDFMKECIKLFTHELPHEPKLERAWDWESATSDEQVWIMPFYRTITAKDKAAWAIMKELERARMDVFHAKMHECLWVKHERIEWYGIDMMNQAIDKANVPEDVKEALQDMADAASSYGQSIFFEFAPRNIGVDENGQIIFRDILFDMEKVRK